MTWGGGLLHSFGLMDFAGPGVANSRVGCCCFPFFGCILYMKSAAPVGYCNYSIMLDESQQSFLKHYITCFGALSVQFGPGNMAVEDHCCDDNMLWREPPA